MTTPQPQPQPAEHPYILDGYPSSFHRSAAGVAWRWRTELVILTGSEPRCCYPAARSP